MYSPEVWHAHKITDDERKELKDLFQEKPHLKALIQNLRFMLSDTVNGIHSDTPGIETSADGAFVIGIRLKDDNKKFVTYHLIPHSVYEKENQ
jgi:hypothetical protein